MSEHTKDQEAFEKEVVLVRDGDGSNSYTSGHGTDGNGLRWVLLSLVNKIDSDRESEIDFMRTERDSALRENESLADLSLQYELVVAERDTARRAAEVLTAKLDAQNATICKYAVHYSLCENNIGLTDRKCDCGLDEAIAKAKAGGTQIDQSILDNAESLAKAKADET